jgi:predicted HAD superfamily Cof-like phosphohydrolase
MSSTKSNLTNFQKVRDFNISFGIGRSSEPDDKLLKLRWDLIKEESDELFDAISKKDYVEIIDALSDILYVVHGAADSFERDFDDYLDKYHEIQKTIKFKTDEIGELSDKIKSLKISEERMAVIFTDQTENEKLNNLINEYSSCIILVNKAFYSKNIHEIMFHLASLHDYMYVFSHLFGIDLDVTFDLVHDSNMSKLAETEEIAKQTVEWYKKNETRYDSPAYRLSTVKVNNQERWVIYNASTGKALKSINYHAVDLKKYLYQTQN